MSLRVLTAAIARVVEHRGGWRMIAERPVVAHVDPTSCDVGLAAGEHRHDGVVTMQPLGREDMGLEPQKERLEHGTAGAYLVGQGGQAEGDALPGVALRLPVQRLMLAELLEHDHGQQARPSPAAGGDVEGCGCLGDLVAVAAGELLADVFEDDPLTGDHLEGLGRVLAQQAQRSLPQHRQFVGAGATTRWRGRCSGKGWREGRLRVNGATLVARAAASSAAISSAVASASSSSSPSSICAIRRVERSERWP